MTRKILKEEVVVIGKVINNFMLEFIFVERERNDDN